MVARIVLKQLIAALQAIDAELSCLSAETKAPPLQSNDAAAASATGRSHLLTVSALADRLNLSKATIYKLVCSKRIDHYKLGSRVLFDERHVEDYLSLREEPRLGLSKRSGMRRSRPVGT